MFGYYATRVLTTKTLPSGHRLALLHGYQTYES